MTDPRKDGDTPLTDALEKTFNAWPDPGLPSLINQRAKALELARQFERQKAALQKILRKMVRCPVGGCDLCREEGKAALAESEVGHDQAG